MIIFVSWAVWFHKRTKQRDVWRKIDFSPEVTFGKLVQVMFSQAVSVCAGADGNIRPVFVTVDTPVSYLEKDDIYDILQFHIYITQNNFFNVMTSISSCFKINLCLKHDRVRNTDRHFNLHFFETVTC